MLMHPHTYYTFHMYSCSYRYYVYVYMYRCIQSAYST